jgi:hypothetical protein
MWACVIVGSSLFFGCNKNEAKEQGATPKPMSEALKSKGPLPAWVASARIHNFGLMDQQESDTHVFEIRNEGAGDLKMQLLESTCGCTVVRLGEIVWDKLKNPEAPATVVVVKPSEAVKLEMTWKTELRTGEFKTVTTLETNDPKQRRADFTVEGAIVPYVELSQANVKFDDARNNEVTTGSVYVYSKKLDNLEITDVTSSNPLITADFEPATEAYLTGMNAKSALKANIKIEPGLPIGPFSAVLTYRTNSEKRPELSVTVGGQVGGDVYITPRDRIVFGAVKATESSIERRFLMFRGDLVAPVEISEPKISLRRLDLRLEPDSSDEATAGIEQSNFLNVSVDRIEAGKNRFQLKVEVPQGAPGGQFRGLIELETTHPTAKVVKIPISLQVTK